MGFVAEKIQCAQRFGFYNVPQDGILRCQQVVAIEADFNYKVIYERNLLTVFGTDIPDAALKEFFENLDHGTWERPCYDVIDGLPKGARSAYNEGTIYVSRRLIERALTDEADRWELYLALLEENAHHVDQLLRKTYCTIDEQCSGPEADGDEGNEFVKRYLNAHNIAAQNILFATVTLQSGQAGLETEKRTLSISTEELSSSIKMEMHKYFSEHRGAERGVITLPNGKVVKVEFYKIEGGGAIHEAITKLAAKRADVVFDDALDKGCAWPDVPCPDEDKVATCYARLLSLEADHSTMPAKTVEWYYKDVITYKSHYGEYQYWHSMSPAKTLTNAQILEKILAQAALWYGQANEYRGKSVKWYNIFKKSYYTNEGAYEDKGLFFMGKILHMVQDSFSHSHTIRDGLNRIISFQNYNLQASGKHGCYDKGDADELDKIPGAMDAVHASMNILNHYRNEDHASKLTDYLKQDVFQLHPDFSKFPSGKVRAGTENKDASASDIYTVPK